MAGISIRQRLVLVGFGFLIWFGAAVLLKYLGSMGAYDGLSRVWLVLSTIPATVPLVLLIMVGAGLGRDRLAVGVSIVVATTLLLDGIALVWWPDLYGDTADQVFGAAAAIIWGAGVGLALGHLLNRSEEPRSLV